MYVCSRLSVVFFASGTENTRERNGYNTIIIRGLKRDVSSAKVGCLFSDVIISLAVALQTAFGIV